MNPEGDEHTFADVVAEAQALVEALTTREPVLNTPATTTDPQEH